MTFSSMNMVYFSIYLGALQFLSMMCCKYTSKCLIWFIYLWVVCFWVMVNRIILLILFSIIHCYSTKVLLILVYWSYILQICWTHLLACFFFLMGFLVFSFSEWIILIDLSSGSLIFLFCLLKYSVDPLYWIFHCKYWTFQFQNSSLVL